MRSAAEPARGPQLVLTPRGFLQPQRLAFWLYLALALYAAPGVVRRLGRDVAIAQPGVALLATVLLVAWLALALWFLAWLDLFEREPVSVVIAAFIWGGFIATGLAGPANNTFLGLIAKLNPDLAADWGASIVAPINEETLKALGVVVIALVARENFNRLLDGLLYGALVGLGFQVVEDFQYIVRAGQSGDQWLTQVLLTFGLRNIVTALVSHTAYTAITGLAIAYVILRTRESLPRRLAVAAVLCLAALVSHGLLDAADSPFALLGVALSTLLGAVVAVLAYRFARREEYHWFAAAVADDIDGPIISRSELQSLASNRSRHKAIAATRRRSGHAAARNLRLLQAAQIAYGVAKANGAGPDDPQLRRRAADITAIRTSAIRPSTDNTG